MTWADIVRVATAWPEVVETTSYGTPSLKVGKAFLGRLRSDPDALVLRVSDMGEREALLQGDPEVFFTIPHYDGHPYVLIRLDRIGEELLGELIEDAWRTRAPKRLVAAWEAGRA